MLIEDERDLRAALHDATGAQPPLSGGLAERAARRYVARRRRRIATTAVAVAAVVAAVPAVTVLHRPPVRRDLATSLPTWPDARAPEWVEASRVALREAERLETDLRPPDTEVRWLYADRAPGTDRVVVAWAYCGPDACTRVVLANHDAAEATTPDSGDGYTSWLFKSGDVTAGAPLAISGYLRGPDGDHGPTNVLVAVVAPHTTAVSWSSPRRLPGTGGSGALARHGGAYYGSVGYLSADATLAVTTRGRTRSAPVGVPGGADPEHGVPPVPEAPVIPPGYESASSSYGPANGTSGEDMTPHGTRVSLFARCDDPGVRVVFGYDDGHYPVVCDGASHAAFLDLPVHGTVLITPEGPPRPYTGLYWTTAYRK